MKIEESQIEKPSILYGATQIKKAKKKISSKTVLKRQTSYEVRKMTERVAKNRIL